MNALIFALLLFFPVTGWALTIRIVQDHTSSTVVTIPPGGTDDWTDPKGGTHNLTCIPTRTSPCVFSITDAINKRDELSVNIGLLSSLANPNYGLSNEPSLSIEGQSIAGSGIFHLNLQGFQGINDVSAAFGASLVANGSDNPIHLEVFGQGDQLQAPKQGTIEFVTKWISNDVIALSNGEFVEIGGFYLVTFGAPTQFVYSLAMEPTLTVAADFMVGESYFFVHDLNLPPEGTNIRQSLLGGTASVHAEGFAISEPSSITLFCAGLLLLLVCTGDLRIVYLTTYHKSKSKLSGSL